MLARHLWIVIIVGLCGAGCGADAPPLSPSPDQGLGDMGGLGDPGQQDMSRRVGDALPESVFVGQVRLSEGGPWQAGWHEAALALHGQGSARRGVLLVNQGKLQVGVSLEGVVLAQERLELVPQTLSCAGEGASSCVDAPLERAPLVGGLLDDVLRLTGQDQVLELELKLRTDLYREPHDGFRPSMVDPPWPPPLEDRPDEVVWAGTWAGAMFTMPDRFEVLDPLQGAGCTLRAERAKAPDSYETWLACFARAQLDELEPEVRFEVKRAQVDLEARRAELEHDGQRWRWLGQLDHQIVLRSDRAHKLYRFFGQAQRMEAGAWVYVGSFAMSSWGDAPSQ